MIETFFPTRASALKLVCALWPRRHTNARTRQLLRDAIHSLRRR
jgi:hypothetical protein